MGKYLRGIVTALVCFLIVLTLNFLLPRLLPGDPIAYLTGFSEEDMTPAQIETYETALHLNEPVLRQFGYYLRSLLDGTLGYSYQKEAVVSELIRDRLAVTLQISLPAVILSAALGLVWGLACGYRKDSLRDRLSTGGMIVLNAVPSFVLGLVFLTLLCFRKRIFPYAGLNSADAVPGTFGYLTDRLYHLILPVFTLTAAALPSRFLLMRNTARKAADEKYLLYARQRGLSARRIRYSYLLPNVVQPFLTMVGMSVSLCVGGSLIVENLFSIPGMGKLLTDAVYTLDYPLMQGILFVTTLLTVISVIVTDVLCIVIDPRLRLGGAK